MNKRDPLFPARSELRAKKRRFRDAVVIPSQTSRGIIIVSGIVGCLIGLFAYPLTLFLIRESLMSVLAYTGLADGLVLPLLLIWGMYAGLAAIYKVVLNYGAAHLEPVRHF